jgi:hypothetical protein
MATSTRPRVANKGKVLRVIQRVSVAVGDVSPARSAASGAPVALGIQTTMTVVIVHEQGAHVSKASVLDRTLTFAAPIGARGVRQFLIGWVPGRGSDWNATATEAVEW